jgi:hypothetical protein
VPAVATICKRTLLVGAAGGVGSAALALLERHALGRRLLEGTTELLLLDRDPPSQTLPPRLADRFAGYRRERSRAPVISTRSCASTRSMK